MSIYCIKIGIICLLERASLSQSKNKRPAWCHLLFYFISYLLNMFRTLMYPSSGACECSVELPHWSYCSWFDVCWSFGVVGLEWHQCCRIRCHLLFYFIYYVLNMFRTLIYPSSGAEACNTDATPTQPHRNSNTHQNKKNTINVVIQENSHKLLMMDILMSETCWARKKWNKIPSDIKLVFYSSTEIRIIRQT